MRKGHVSEILISDNNFSFLSYSRCLVSTYLSLCFVSFAYLYFLSLIVKSLWFTSLWTILYGFFSIAFSTARWLLSVYQRECRVETRYAGDGSQTRTEENAHSLPFYKTLCTVRTFYTCCRVGGCQNNSWQPANAEVYVSNVPILKEIILTAKLTFNSRRRV